MPSPLKADHAAERADERVIQRPGQTATWPAADAGGVSTSTIFLWACAGYLVPYVLLFVAPVFFARPTMYIAQPLPWMNPIASDLRAVTEMGGLWLDGGTPYNGNNLYPPLSTLLFAAWFTIGFDAAHVVLVLLSIASFMSMSLWLAFHHATDWRRLSPMVPVFMFTALRSYGMQFEFERGQFNLLAMGLSMCGVILFHARPRWKLLAYAMFSTGVQLKLYPAIFVLLLTHDYRDLIGNIRRAAWLVAINVLLLFATGPRLFADFVVALDQLAFKFGGWAANHSIYSFAHYAVDTLNRHVTLPEASARIAETAMLAFLLGCLGVIVAINRRDARFGLDPYLLLACTVGAMLIPPISYDYKLSILAPAMGMAAIEFERCAASRIHPRAPGLAVLAVMVAAYTTTLWTFELKPTVLDNNCPALLVIVACVTLLAAMRSRTIRAGLRLSAA